MFTTFAILCFLAGLWLGRRQWRDRRAPPAVAAHEWIAFAQGARVALPRRAGPETPGRIYLHSPP